MLLIENQMLKIPQDMSENFSKNVILFDGICNLCNDVVNLLLDLDKSNILYFSSLQSDFGQFVLQKFNLPTDNFNSFIFLKKGKIYQKSDGALEVCRTLGGFWKILYFFKIIPTFARNAIYEWVAQNRYRWFGKKEYCRVPTPNLQARFLS